MKNSTPEKAALLKRLESGGFNVPEFIYVSAEDFKNENFEDYDFQNWRKRWQEGLKTNNNSPEKYIKLMRSVNPIVIPRNHKVEEVLNEANNNNTEPLKRFLEILNNPYSEQKNIKEFRSPSFSKEKYQTFCGT